MNNKKRNSSDQSPPTPNVDSKTPIIFEVATPNLRKNLPILNLSEVTFDTIASEQCTLIQMAENTLPVTGNNTTPLILQVATPNLRNTPQTRISLFLSPVILKNTTVQAKMESMEGAGIEECTSDVPVNLEPIAIDCTGPTEIAPNPVSSDISGGMQVSESSTGSHFVNHSLQEDFSSNIPRTMGLTSSSFTLPFLGKTPGYIDDITADEKKKIAKKKFKRPVSDIREFLNITHKKFNEGRPLTHIFSQGRTYTYNQLEPCKGNVIKPKPKSKSKSRKSKKNPGIDTNVVMSKMSSMEAGLEISNV